MERILTFSQRNGHKSVSDIIILKSMPEIIINSICNVYRDCFCRTFSISSHYIERYDQKIEEMIWRYFFNEESTSRSYDHDIIIDKIKSKELYFKWHEKLSLLEAIVYYGRKLPYFDYREEVAVSQFVAEINSEFKRLNYGYRFIGDIIVEINSEEEIQSIETAIADNDGGVRIHIQSALSFLSPSATDYRNSIKESMSAVEAKVRILTNKNELGSALDELKKQGIEVHNVLAKGMKSIYGYTCDKDTGIRHALIEEGYTTTQEDAVYMLVMCSAFINYINAKRAK